MNLSIDFLKVMLNTLEEHIVVINADGSIMCSNQSWNAFSEQNDYDSKKGWADVNYLDVCDLSAKSGDSYAIKSAKGIRDVIAGKTSTFSLEYPCHSPEEKRWFIMKVTPFHVDKTVFYSITHYNITQRKLAEEKMMNLSRIDGLTNIPNRRYFDTFFLDEYKRCSRLNLPLSFAMVDIDYFKKYNDTYGHVKGDEVLKKIAHYLSQAFKRPSDICARYGGEEFAVVLGNTTYSNALRMIEKVRKRIENIQILDQHSSHSAQVTISAGIITLIPSTKLSISEILTRADQLLYEAKKQGRNCIVGENNTNIDLSR